MHEETFQVVLPPTQCARTQCLLLMVVRKALIEGNACVLGSLCETVYLYLQDITFQKVLWILYHYNLQTFVLGSYSLMNVVLEWEQLLQVQLGNIPKGVPWGECSCLCNPIFLFGQTVSITWQLMESRLTLYLCRCGCMLSIAWGPGILSVTVPTMWCEGTSSPLAQLHEEAAVGSGVCLLSTLSIACLFLQPLRDRKSVV